MRFWCVLATSTLPLTCFVTFASAGDNPAAHGPDDKRTAKKPIEKPIVLRPVPLKSATAIICQNRYELNEKLVAPAANTLREARQKLDALTAFDTRDQKRQKQTMEESRKKLQRVLGKECEPLINALMFAQEGAFLGAVTLPGSSWDAAVASGLAQFLAQRANDEITLWLAEQISTQVCADDQLKSFLPRTCDIGFKKEYATSLGALLASSLRQDLEDLPFALLAKILELTDPDSRALRSMGAVARAIRNGVSAPSALAGLAHSRDLQALCTGEPKSTVACWLGEIGLFCEYSRELAEARNKSDAVKTVSDLVIQACRVDRSEKVFCEGLQDLWNRSCNGRPESASCRELSDTFVTILKAVSQIIDDVRQWHQSPPTDTAAVLARAGEVLGALESLLGASINLLGADDKLRKGWDTAHPFFSAAAELLKGNYADGVRDSLAQLDKLAPLPAPTVRYIPVLVDLSQAKDAGTVKSLIETAAAPVGSWRLKRQPEPDIHIAVTGIVGIAPGGEVPIASGYSGGLTYGLIGALGVDFAGPCCWDGWTIGAFASILDVGQLITAPAFPNKDQDRKAAAGGSFSIVQILSPGAYFRLGLGNSPFIFGAGVAVAPNLRKYDQLGPDNSVLSSKQITVLRAQAFIAVDLTLFPIR